MRPRSAGLVTDDDPAAAEIRVVPSLPAHVTAELAEARQARADADKLATRSSALFRHAARDLRADGLSVRDVGRVLGVSFQRAGQLLAGRPPSNV